MYTVSNLTSGKSDEVNFEQLSEKVGEPLDESFYTDVFTAHTLTGKDGQLVVVKE